MFNLFRFLTSRLADHSIGLVQSMRRTGKSDEHSVRSQATDTQKMNPYPSDDCKWCYVSRNFRPFQLSTFHNDKATEFRTRRRFRAHSLLLQVMKFNQKIHRLPIILLAVRNCGTISKIRCLWRRLESPMRLRFMRERLMCIAHPLNQSLRECPRTEAGRRWTFQRHVSLHRMEEFVTGMEMTNHSHPFFETTLWFGREKRWFIFSNRLASDLIANKSLV